MALDTARPYNPDAPAAREPFDGIRLESISYAYEGRKTSLRNINLKISHGKTTALVGLSGCGKSTVAGLLMRFFDPAAGRILIEGRDYTRRALSSATARCMTSASPAATIYPALAAATRRFPSPTPQRPERTRQTL